MIGEEERDELEGAADGRPVRVIFPIRVSFAGETFVIDEFTGNLSVVGLFLPTTRVIPAGTRGSLTFRISRWEQPFTVEGEVVRSEPPGSETESRPSGLGIQFVNLDRLHLERLGRLIHGLRDGSVSEAIRRVLREEKRTLGQELRRRTTDEKVMFAMSARGEEIEVLIRDGNAAAILRLFQNPHLSVANVRSILRDSGLPARVLAVVNSPRWLVDEESRMLYCVHPNVPVQEALAILPRLSRKTLLTLEGRPNLRVQLVAGIRQMLRKSVSPGAK